MWAHTWQIDSPPTVDGVIVGALHNGYGYCEFGEIHRSTAADAHQAAIGTMVHELGHLIFGFPDLYDTDGSSDGIGIYDVMAGGSWGKKETDPYQGMTPVQPSAWTRTTLSWLVPPEGNGIQAVTDAVD